MTLQPRAEKFKRKPKKKFRWKPEKKRRQPLAAVKGGRHVRSVVLFGLFGCFDLALFWAALQEASLLLLLLRTTMMLAVVYLVQPSTNIRPWSSRQALTAFAAIFLPGAGSFVAAFWSWQVTRVQGAWQDVPVSPPLYRSQIDWNEVLDVVPLIDVLNGDDTERKKRTLLHLQTMRSAIEAKVVRQALADPDPEVRYYAASLLSHAEAVHTSRINNIDRELKRNPDEPALWNDLAAEYRALIDEGIAGDELGRFYQEKRLLALERSLALEPKQPLAGLEKANVLFALGHVEEAEQEARRWLSTHTAPLILDRARAVLIKTAYARGDQEELKRHARAVQEMEHLPEDVRGLVELRQQKEM